MKQVIVTSEEMKTLDHATSEKIGIPSLVLMERAALETVSVLQSYLQKKDKILIVSGTGNNGGDGLVIGRLLADLGYAVSFVMPENNSFSKETLLQKTILENLGFSIMHQFDNSEYAMVIDALFGVGLSREITGVYKEMICKIHEYQKKGAKIVSVDIPSGISSDTGKVLGIAVKADLTVTYEYLKRGHLLYPGKEYSGEIFVRSVGIIRPDQINQTVSAFSYDLADWKELLPKRALFGNKGTFGKVLVVAGSYNMCGAALLSAESALRTGCGMVKIVTPEENRCIVQSHFPEALLYTYGNDICEEEFIEQMNWADVIVAGPGISCNQQAFSLLKMILKNGEKKLVIDADGLNLIAGNDELRALLKSYQKDRVILTPHPVEFTRLAKCTLDAYKEDPFSKIKALAYELGCTMIGKDAVTIVAAYDQEQIYINQTGNDGMATAGSGDVLSGIVGALFVSMNAFDAACLGTFLHGLSGDEAAHTIGQRAMIASDLIKSLGGILN